MNKIADYIKTKKILKQNSTHFIHDNIPNTTRNACKSFANSVTDRCLC